MAEVERDSREGSEVPGMQVWAKASLGGDREPLSQVECVRCGKWRELGTAVDPLGLPEDWHCGLLTDPALADCSVPERPPKATSPDGERVYVETPGMGPGSVVWARLSGWPHWPALLTYEPGSKQLFSLRPGTADPPVIKAYHVRFLGPRPSTGWVDRRHLLLFDGHDPRSLPGAAGKKVRAAWSKQAFAKAREEAALALAETNLRQRLNAFPNPRVPLNVKPKPTGGPSDPGHKPILLQITSKKGQMNVYTGRKRGRKPGDKTPVNGAAKAKLKQREPKTKTKRSAVRVLKPAVGVEDAIAAVLSAIKETGGGQRAEVGESGSSLDDRIERSIDSVRLAVALGEYHAPASTPQKKKPKLLAKQPPSASGASAKFPPPPEPSKPKKQPKAKMTIPGRKNSNAGRAIPASESRAEPEEQPSSSSSEAAKGSPSWTEPHDEDVDGDAAAVPVAVAGLAVSASATEEETHHQQSQKVPFHRVFQ